MLTRFLEPGSYYLCSPSAYEGAAWTSPKGMEHIEALLDYISSHYPARLDSLSVVGVSDGSLGALRYARFGKRKPLRFVLFSVYPTLAVERPMETYSSYTSTRWDIFQGGRDRLFPAREVLPLLQNWGKANPRVTLHLFPEGEHDFAWYAENAGDRIRRIFGGDRILMMNDE
jgi:pimeloyl-ACP methyl ester carboxylesterase